MTFAVGDYVDKVDCDVMPMDACQLLLGRPWQFDRDAVHAGKSNTYTFKHDGRRHVLKPMLDSVITINMEVPKKKVLKVGSKPRTVLFQEREDDTNLQIPSTSRNDYVAVTKDKMTDIAKGQLISCGKDGKLRVLCGPRPEPKQNYCQVNNRRKILYRDQPTQPSTKMPPIWSKKLTRTNIEEPKPEEITPTFRTPPCRLFVGSLPIWIDLGR
mgnify:FL=1